MSKDCYWIHNRSKEHDNPLEEVSRSEYRDILLARMAGGDLYASEDLAKIRRVDMMLDAFRGKPIYERK